MLPRVVVVPVPRDPDPGPWDPVIAALQIHLIIPGLFSGPAYSGPNDPIRLGVLLKLWKTARISPIFLKFSDGIMSSEPAVRCVVQTLIKLSTAVSAQAGTEFKTK